MPDRLVTGPAVEPIHLDAAKLFLRVDIAAEDSYIRRLVHAGRERTEALTCLALVTQVRRLTLPGFPYDEQQLLVGEPADQILIPTYPVQAVTALVYTDDETGVETEITDFQLDTAARPCRIVPAYDSTWPSARAVPNSVRITYRAGFAARITAEAATDTLTVSGRTFVDGDVVRLANSGGALPDPLEEMTDYHVVNASGATFQLAAAAGGSAITLTDSGTGTHLAGEIPEQALHLMQMLIANAYNHRDPIVTGTVMNELPLGLRSLVRSLKVYR